MGKHGQKLSLVFLALFISSHSAGAQSLKPPVDRKAAFAGSFYPAEKSALESQLRILFAEAKPMDAGGAIQTLIVPHAGYDYSGIVAASGYKSISAEASYDNIFIIAASRREEFSGVSVYSAGDYLTPLGKAKVNRELAQALIQGNSNIKYLPEAHTREHSIEVQIPFLQYHFRELPPLVPLIIGSSSVAAARDLASALLPWFTPNNLFIITSNFSQFPSYREAIQIDKITGEAILTGNPEIFYNALRTSSTKSVANLSTPCNGWSAIMSMLYMADRSALYKVSPVHYSNSGDSNIGNKERVVGYWAIAGTVSLPEERIFELSEQDKDQLLEISRSTLESFIRTGELPEIDLKALSPVLKQEVGAFVTLYMGDRLRGRMGTFTPTNPLYAVVEEMTLAAAINDSRFSPVEEPELEYIKIEISVLTPLQKISSIEEFELGRHGILMVKDGHSGTFLPQVAEETGWTTEEFLGHCARDEAGIGWDDWKEAELFIFETILMDENREK